MRKVIVSVKINRETALELRESDIWLIERDENCEKTINERHAKEAKALGRKPFRGNRQKADSGIPVFGWGGRENVRLNNVISDLKALGLEMIDVHTIAGAEWGYTLRLTFDQGKPVLLNSEAISIINGVLSKTIHHVYVFDNPNKTYTVNSKGLNVASDQFHHLRILAGNNGDYSFRCE